MPIDVVKALKSDIIM